MNTTEKALALSIQVTSSHTSSATVGQYGSACKEMIGLNEEIKNIIGEEKYNELLNHDLAGT